MEKTEDMPSDLKVEEGDKVKSGVDLDRILIEEIGQFGWFQLWTVALVVFAVTCNGMANNDYVFTAARINTRCLIPECESAEQPAIFSPSWILNAVPASGSSFDSCQRFANVSSADDLNTCPASLFDSNNIISCEEHVYETSDTVVYDFGLACQEWKRSYIGSAFTFGMLFSHGITGIISDRWGRRTALAINGLCRVCIGFTRSLINSYAGFTILQFTESFVGSGIYHSAFILAVELVGPQTRLTVSALMLTFHAVGNICLGLLAWAINNWRHLTQTIYAPMLVIPFYYWIAPESIRWYISKGRFEEAVGVLKKAARVNRTHLSDKSLEALRQLAEDQRRNKTFKEMGKEDDTWLILQVFRYKQVLIRCLVTPVWWVTNVFVYYGLTINAVNVSGNRYLNYIVVAAIEIPGYWTSMILMSKIGRRPVLTGAFWLCAACQAAYILMPNDYHGYSLLVYLVGKFAISMTMTVVYSYTAELFPTRYRHSLLAFCSVIGRIGGVIAPLTPAMGASTFEDLPYMLFGGFALLAGSLVFVMPETLGAKFPDTMEEASDIGKKNEASK